MPERMGFETDASKDDLERRNLATKAHSYLQYAYFSMTLEQKGWLVNTIIFFEGLESLKHIETLLNMYELEERYIQGIMGCLLDDESRTELVKIIGVKGFM